MIPVEQINVLNPRDRSKKKFGQIVGNIARLGLKKPITVCHAGGRNGEARYDLVCGQGRLEAFASLGQEVIPAIVVEGTKEDLLLMSLAENLARRQHSTVELVREIRLAEGAGLHPVADRPQDRLWIPAMSGASSSSWIRARSDCSKPSRRGNCPLSIAITIATSDDKAVQRALQEAYEKNDLRGKALLRARRLIESRRAKGQEVQRRAAQSDSTPVSSHDLLKTFQEETMQQRLIIQKAKICETRLLFAVSALKQLFQDDHFVTLLRAEGLDSLPQYSGASKSDKRGSAHERPGPPGLPTRSHRGPAGEHPADAGARRRRPQDAVSTSASRPRSGSWA